MKSIIEVNPAEFNKTFIFNGGEVHTTLKLNKGMCKSRGKVQVHALIRDSDGVMQLALIKDILNRELPVEVKKHLNLEYLPYARQDRVCNEGEALSLKVFCDMINNMGWDEVTVHDVHSDVALALLNNVKHITQPYCMGWTSLDLLNELRGGNYVLVSPDAGANKKTLEVAKHFNVKEVIRADKVRDVSTGQILATEVYCGDLTGKKLLIVDDILDGGATFIELAKKLKEKGAEVVALYITHGIFAKGKDVLYDAGIDIIYCRFDWTKYQ